MPDNGSQQMLGNSDGARPKEMIELCGEDLMDSQR
jgi:hypothetical protein